MNLRTLWGHRGKFCSVSVENWKCQVPLITANKTLKLLSCKSSFSGISTYGKRKSLNLTCASIFGTDLVLHVLVLELSPFPASLELLAQWVLWINAGLGV